MITKIKRSSILDSIFSKEAFEVPEGALRGVANVADDVVLWAMKHRPGHTAQPEEKEVPHAPGTPHVPLALKQAAEDIGALLFDIMIKEGNQPHTFKIDESQFKQLNHNLRMLNKNLSPHGDTWKDTAKSIAKPLVGMAVLHGANKFITNPKVHEFVKDFIKEVPWDKAKDMFKGLFS